jgi:hypothetical protein
MDNYPGKQFEDVIIGTAQIRSGSDTDIAIVTEKMVGSTESACR